jgi:hypothetical protein
MKKSYLLGAACALTLFAMISSASAAMVASDDTSLTSTGQSYAQTFALSPSSLTDGALTFNVPGDFGQIESDENFDYSIDGTLPVAGPHADSHASFWLLLIVAGIAGILSEIIHRRSFNR